MEKESLMDESYLLKELEQVRVLADPVRLKILEAFCQTPMTTKQVAKLLDEKQTTKLYHHVDALERVGLIKLIKTQQNRGTVEKYYQAVARKFAVDHQLFQLLSPEQGGDELQALFSGMLEATMLEIRDSISAKLIERDSKRRNALMSRLHICATQPEIEELMEKLQGWLKKCQSYHHKRGDVEYGLTLAFYPLKRTNQKETRKDQLKTETKAETRTSAKVSTKAEAKADAKAEAKANRKREKPGKSERS